MQYKTIVLELLLQHPQMYEELRSTKRLLTAMDTYASDLKARHDAWTRILHWNRPTSTPEQLSSAALELAIQDLQDRFPCEATMEADEAPSLDAAMSYLRRHTPHA